MMQNELIKQMVERFLGWSLPENFNPDDGISFEPVANKGTVYEFKRQPTGTNLLDYTQAEAMVRYMVEGLERTSSTKEGPSEGWCITMARLEGDAEISAGAIDHPLRCPPLGAPTTDSTDLEARARRVAFRALLPSHPYFTDAEMDLMLERPEGGPKLDSNAVLSVVISALTDSADTLASYRAEIAQLRDKLARARDDALEHAGREVADKLWILRCNSRDDLDRKAAERACDMWDAALRSGEHMKDCPSCHGLNISCPDGCGRDPETGELNGTRYEHMKGEG